MAYTTRKSILREVRDGSEIGWQTFYCTYRPLILRRGMDFNLRPQELEELLQQVMIEFFRKDLIGTRFDVDRIPDDLMFRYDGGKGRFRDFLRRVVSNHACKLLRARSNYQNVDEANDLPFCADDESNHAWELEWHQHLLTEALPELRSQVESQTYQAFELYALQGKSVQEVADFLGISPNSVYVARTRCVAKLKKIVRELEEQEG